VRELLGIDLGCNGGDPGTGDEDVSVLEGLSPISVDDAHVTQQSRPRVGGLSPGGSGKKQDCDNERGNSDVHGKARECRRDASMLG
jgi:hypothetical protein